MSNRVVELHPAELAVEQASEWIVRLESAHLSAEDVDRFTAWYRHSRENAQAFNELVNLWEGLDHLSLLAELVPLEDSVALPPKTNTRVARHYYWATACILLLVTLVVGFQYWRLTREGRDFQQQYSTAVGEHRQIVLPDGSVVQLNTDSRLSVNYSREQRNLALHSGEAHFDVAKNPRRPFIVHAGEGTVKAVGTAFNVLLKGARVNVTVTEGKVEVATPSTLPAEENDATVAPATRVAAVTAGHQVAFEKTIEAIDAVTPKAIDRQLAWQRGMLIFDGVPIAQAIEEINRYSRQPIIIDDPSINSILVGGYFRSGATDEMLNVFESSFGIKVTRNADGVILLSAADSRNQLH
jgi:transmembrane sensor